jgi:hypothetical protein
MNLNINEEEVYRNIKRKLGFNLLPNPSGGGALYSLISVSRRR